MPTPIEKLARKIARLTQNNDHCASVLLLAEFLDNKKAIDRMEQIMEIHEKLGHMPYELIQERMQINKDLRNIVIFVYGETAANKISRAF